MVMLTHSRKQEDKSFVQRAFVVMKWRGRKNLLDENGGEKVRKRKGGASIRAKKVKREARW